VVEWKFPEAAIDAKDADHARRLADQDRDKAGAYDRVELKLAYFQGVLDWAAMMEAGGDS
jgi:hypothetical protein